MNIFVVDQSSKKLLGIIDFVPREDDIIILKESEWKYIECRVNCRVYTPHEHSIVIFVTICEPNYFKKLSEIDWKKVR